MTSVFVLVVVIILVALAFDFLNGFHDAANSIATVVSTRVLSPRVAVIWAAVFNFVAAFGFGTAVAKTVGKGMINLNDVTQAVILAGLLGAIVWNLLTWYYGIPVSSSHALVGGYAGAAIARAGSGALIFSGWTNTLVFMVVAPTIGLIAGFMLMSLVYLLFRNQTPLSVDHWFRRLQLCSAAAFSLAHGTNDAQKTMGIIASALATAGYLDRQHLEIPFWVVIAANGFIALGTLAGGWRIVHTMGSRITKLRPVGGFSAETAAAATILTGAHFGVLLSTTHVITGSIVGVGAMQRFSAVRWGVAARIFWAWVITIPASAAVAYGVFAVLRLFFPGA